MPLQSCVIGLGQGQILQIISLAREVATSSWIGCKSYLLFFFYLQNAYSLHKTSKPSYILELNTGAEKIKY